MKRAPRTVLPRAGQRVLCAVSGGLDSMCLLHMLKAWCEERGGQAAAAHFHAVRHMGPAQPFRIYTDLVKQSRLQIIMQSQSRFFAHDGSQQRGADAVVHVSRTRLILHGNRQKVPDPVNGRLRHLFHAAAHAQYVLHAQLLQVLRRRFWRLFRENINDPFFQRKNAFRVCDSHCRGGIGLCM